MEDLSHFIHEEIFLIDEPVSISSEVAAVAEPIEDYEKSAIKPELTHQIGIVTGNASETDMKLLDAILGAIKTSRNEVLISTETSRNAKIWLDFSEQANQVFTVLSKEDHKVICSSSLSKLNGSKELKGELWKILKNHFEI